MYAIESTWYNNNENDMIIMKNDIIIMKNVIGVKKERQNTIK